LVVEFAGIDEEADDYDVLDISGDDEAVRMKDVNCIQVEVIDIGYDFGPQACCLMNNGTLRRLLDANDKVIRLPHCSKLSILTIIIAIISLKG